METKICTKCENDKNLSEFYKRNNQCKSCYKEHVKKYRSENKEYFKEYRKKYIEKNKDKIRKSQKEYNKLKYHSDPLVNLKIRLRRRTTSVFENKTKSTLNIIGCSYEQVYEYLENKFTCGMSWDNKGEWHIDHIIPLSSATTEEELIKLCHYTNLQPLWAKDNLKKGSKIKNNCF